MAEFEVSTQMGFDYMIFSMMLQHCPMEFGLRVIDLFILMGSGTEPINSRDFGEDHCPHGQTHGARDSRIAECRPFDCVLAAIARRECCGKAHSNERRLYALVIFTVNSICSDLLLRHNYGDILSAELDFNFGVHGHYGSTVFVPRPAADGDYATQEISQVSSSVVLQCGEVLEVVGVLDYDVLGELGREEIGPILVCLNDIGLGT
jgi:hypothetical protein